MHGYNLVKLVVTGIICTLVALFCPSQAHAQIDPWEFEVYPYKTEPRGMIELETDNTVIPNGHSQSGSGTAKGTYPSQGMWYNAYELTYGLTDRIEAAVYLNMAMPRGHGYWWAGDKIRVRGRLFDEETLPVNWLVYRTRMA